MKGISEIIATILILMIVVGLAGTAYTYIQGSLTGRTTKQIDVLDVSCNSASNPQQMYITLKNLDPKLSINAAQDLAVIRVQNVPLTTPIWWSGNSSTIGSNNVSTANFTPPMSVTPGNSYTVRIVGPSNSVEKSTIC